MRITAATERVVLVPGAFVGVLIRDVGLLPRVRLLMVRKPRPGGERERPTVSAPFFPVAKRTGSRRPA